MRVELELNRRPFISMKPFTQTISHLDVFKMVDYRKSEKSLGRSLLPVGPAVLQTFAVCSVAETKGHILLHFKDL